MMTIDDVIRRIGEIGIIPVVRAASVDEAARAVDVICSGGIPVVEITMTVPGAVSVIREVSEQYRGKVLVGAGTVITSQQAEACIEAGAEFLVSPGLSSAVLSLAQQKSVLAIPGGLSPTELMSAHQHGAKLVKIFPCGSVGGPKYLKSLLAPFPQAMLIPTGGVNAGNAAEYLAAGAFALGIGADLVDVKALREGNTAKITAAAQQLVGAVASARVAKEKSTVQPVH